MIMRIFRSVFFILLSLLTLGVASLSTSCKKDEPSQKENATHVVWVGEWKPVGIYVYGRENMKPFLLTLRNQKEGLDTLRGKVFPFIKSLVVSKGSQEKVFGTLTDRMIAKDNESAEHFCDLFANAVWNLKGDGTYEITGLADVTEPVAGSWSETDKRVILSGTTPVLEGKYQEAICGVLSSIMLDKQVELTWAEELQMHKDRGIPKVLLLPTSWSVFMPMLAAYYEKQGEKNHAATLRKVAEKYGYIELSVIFYKRLDGHF